MWPEKEVDCMCGNRVEELESQVKELQASVEGLTDELVECKVRIRELEAAVDEELGFVPELPDDEEAEPEAETDGKEEIREPEPGEAGDMAEAPNTEGTDDADNAEESGSDIIVA
jgi:uncharacterized coiled-coil protein SlyX